MRRPIPLLALTLVAATARAQLGTGTIADGNVYYQHLSFATSNSSAAGFANLRATGASGLDHLYQANWFWRLAGDPREYALHGGGGQGAMSSWYSGDRVVHRWAALDGRSFAALREIRVFATGPTAGFAVDKLTITNHTAAAVRVNLFAYVDSDLCGTSAADSAAANPTADKIVVRDAACTAAGEVFAPGADHFQVAAYPDIATRLTDTVADTLADRGLPFGPDDLTGAWQWQDRLVSPGASFSAWLVLGVDAVHLGCTMLADARTYGAGKAGTWGVPAFDEAPRPLLGTTAELTIDGGFPGGAPFCLLGTARASTPFPPYGTILVVPAASVFGGIFDPMRKSRTPIPIPNVRQLCGSTVHFQAFMADPGAAGFVAHTGGLSWSLGGLF